MRCGHELVIVEKVPDKPEQPEEPQIRYAHEEYIGKLENSICLTLRRLRKKAKLNQSEVAERGHFGTRTYISKVENPQGSNRTIPTLGSLERFAVALNVEAWKIVAMAEEKVGKPEQNEWLAWWNEIFPLLKRLHPRERDVVLAAARGMKSKKTVANGHYKH